MKNGKRYVAYSAVLIAVFALTVMGFSEDFFGEEAGHYMGILVRNLAISGASIAGINWKLGKPKK